METRMNRSDVDMMLGIAPCQDCRDDILFATPIIRRQYARKPVELSISEHPSGAGRVSDDNMHPVDLAWLEEMGAAA
jgi:hypothetical protein